MKLVKSLLLGSAAGLAAVAGAQAADLPARKAAPVVDYVRVCSAYGSGFFFIPGTETCLRVGGRVRAEYLYFEPGTRADSATGFRGRGRLNIDARTQTAYGTLRTFIRYELTRNSGSYLNLAGGAGATSTTLVNAFIQFAGVTAGRASSFFDFYANDLNWGGLASGSDTAGSGINLLAYTATFGSGFSATIAIEDPEIRRTGLAYANGTLPGAGNFSYAGQRMPEVVANLRVDQAWGSAQIAGAVHQLFGGNREASGAFVDTEYGFALTAGAKINLPFIAPGDVLWLQATYAEGAINYLGFGGQNSAGAITQNAVSVFAGDARVDAFGNVKKTDGYVLTAAFLHYWTPQLRQGVFGSFGRIDYAAAVSTPVSAVTGARPVGAVVDTTFWQIGTNLIFSPVRDLDIGVEVFYRTVDPRGRIVDNTRPGFTTGKDDAFEGRLRVQRDF